VFCDLAGINLFWAISSVVTTSDWQVKWADSSLSKYPCF
jgi:hypothetical protein